jgi:hypothetical protein
VDAKNMGSGASKVRPNPFAQREFVWQIGATKLAAASIPATGMAGCAARAIMAIG